MAPFRERRAYLEAHPEAVEAILRAGAARAHEAARATLAAARKAVGLD